ncbi:hypothetical protein GCM10027610_024720 [Dactylosporangium cerinum]
MGPRLTAADAFVVVTPEYNRSFPAPLKTAIDWFYEEWHAKPVTFVSYGRESGGLHATAQLRQVFNELQTVTMRNTVSLPAIGSCSPPTARGPSPPRAATPRSRPCSTS